MGGRGGKSGLSPGGGYGGFGTLQGLIGARQEAQQQNSGAGNGGNLFNAGEGNSNPDYKDNGNPELVKSQNQTDENKMAAFLAKLLKAFRFTPVSSRGWKDAHTTSGGIALEEFDPATLESKVVSGLFAAGEVLDVDAPCGGYSLTWAFSSGWVAGIAASRALSSVVLANDRRDGE